MLYLGGTDWTGNSGIAFNQSSGIEYTQGTLSIGAPDISIGTAGQMGELSLNGGGDYGISLNVPNSRSGIYFNGNLILSNSQYHHTYGTTLPASGFEGQLFFQI